MSDLRVYIEPNYNVPDRAEGGIRRVVEAQFRYLPEFGIEPVKDLRLADVVAGHAVTLPQKAGAPFISHCHGLHWSDYEWPRWAEQVNQDVTESMIRAQAVTAPSRWVAQAITRGVLRRPTVVYHGVDADEWAPAPSQSFVLWNKARADAVSDPSPVQVLGRRMPDVGFVTTIGMPTDNVQVVGVVPLPQMKPIVQAAGVYLATARETFGIGTLEALACGVPVAGWDYGGQSEIVVQGETGYLAPYGDWAALEGCLRQCLRERARLSANARADVLARWGWADKVRQYAEIYHQVWNAWTEPRPTVSVIVPCHNLARFLPDALRSVQAQPYRDWECIVVDDGSTDDTRAVVESFAGADGRFQYTRTPHNLGLCGALNHGFDQSIGRYIVNLDADNLLGEQALGILAEALDGRPELHIVYGPLDTVNSEGQDRKRGTWPGAMDYDWRAQMAHLNQVPSGAMVRREVRVETGGYRERMWRAEDAEFWCRATSFGFRAGRVTDETTLIYRWRDDSKSMLEHRTAGGDGDWTAWFPWRMGAANGREGLDLLPQRIEIPRSDLVPFGAQGRPIRPGRLAWDVWHHQAPAVSVVIPVGPGHERLVLDALDSLIAQDVADWEAVVVNNTGHALPEIPGAPYARIVQADQITRNQVGAARNAGVQAARGQLVYFLDADDYLRPGGLKALLVEYAKGEASYIYSDYLEVGPDHAEMLKEMPDYDQQEWHNLHSINVLMARADALRIGFDETLPGWEDWEFFVHCAVLGICGRRLAHPAWCYRKHTGTRRDDSLSQKDALLPVLRERYAAYYNGVKNMGSCCGGNGDAVLAAKAAVLAAAGPGVYQTGPAQPVSAPPAEPSRTLTVVRMEFIGEQVGAITFFGQGGRQYRGGNNPIERYADVAPEDVERLANSGYWRAVPLPEPEPMSADIPVAMVTQSLGPDLFQYPPEPPAPQPGDVVTKEPRKRKGRKA